MLFLPHPAASARVPSRAPRGEALPGGSPDRTAGVLPHRWPGPRSQAKRFCGGGCFLSRPWEKGKQG